jgi:hypothetical protein
MLHGLKGKYIQMIKSEQCKKPNFFQKIFLYYFFGKIYFLGKNNLFSNKIPFSFSKNSQMFFSCQMGTL